jgi:hypothetical protein
MLVVSWSVPADDSAGWNLAQQDAAAIISQLEALLHRSGVMTNTPICHTLHQGLLDVTQPMAAQWRTLFAQATLMLEYAQNPPLPESTQPST